MKYPMIKSEYDRMWLKYCGFLDFSVQQFMSLQESLLRQQIERLAQCSLGQKLIGKKMPLSTNEFRRLVPLTKYEDYLPELEMGDENCLPEKPFIWAHTSGGLDTFRRVPITHEANRKQLDNLLTIFILACSKFRGQSSINEGDRVLFNVAPSPYLSGILAKGAVENFNLTSVMDPNQQNAMEFKEKMAKGFEVSLRTGIDILLAMTSVLVKIGNDFDKRSQSNSISKHLLHPGEFCRVTKGYLGSKFNKRHMLPKDIWRLKAIIGWGSDTDIYQEEVYKYWGAYPFQFHGCTEAGLMAVQNWNRKDLTFIPQSNFYEFIPEVEWLKARNDIFYQPQTVLLSEVKPGGRYEVVVTSFYGMPFVRYRLGHMIRITALADEEARINLPQMKFESRADDLIDIAGFTRISEKSVSQAISESGLDYEDWLICKENQDGKPTLHLYIELNRDYPLADLASVVHGELMKVDSGYCDLATMMEINPLQITILPHGSFNNYSKNRLEAGREAVKQRPPRMNPSLEVIGELMGSPVRNAVLTG